MTTTSYLRGHKIVEVNEDWLFVDTMESTAETWIYRPCGVCGKQPTEEGHDGCLRTLPDITNACCGHGITQEAYIQFPDGICVRGSAAIAFFDAISDEKYQHIN